MNSYVELTTHPEQWTPPVWHEDFGDPQPELERLRLLALGLHAEGLSCRLDCYEPGYMRVEVFKGELQVAEYCMVGAPRVARYAVFVGRGSDQTEWYSDSADNARAHIVRAAGGR